MKSKILKLTSVLLFFSFSYGCEKIKYEDQYPGVSIYKTKGDYFDLVAVGMKEDRFYRTQILWNPRYNSFIKLEIRNNDTIYKFRHRLIDGYVLGGEAGLNTDVFLNITFKEYLKRQLRNYESGIGAYVPDDTLRKYILDKDPYTEFYQNRTGAKRLYMRDSLEINEIIENGEIDKYFKKLK